jgi:hypothetical protein
MLRPGALRLYREFEKRRTMMRQFGDRATFCVEIGGIATPGLRVVDVWAAGTWLTTKDNAAYVPSFTHLMRWDLERVRRGDILPRPFPGRTPEEICRLLRADQTGFGQQFWFLHWGETLDNVASYAYLAGDLVIVFEHWPTNDPADKHLGKVAVVRIPPDEFATIAEEAAAVLDAEYIR